MSEAAARSQLFQPYRCVGHVTSAVPFALNKMGQASFAVVSVGRAFQIYNVRLLRAWGVC
jgi:U3 small nucleolar RNA-associated protein 21